MKRTSRKTINPARKRTDHSAGCRLSDAEHARAIADVAETSKGSGIPISLGAYVKHATLEHFRLRKLEVLVLDIIAREDRRQDAEPVDFEIVIEALRQGAGKS